MVPPRAAGLKLEGFGLTLKGKWWIQCQHLKMTVLHHLQSPSTQCKTTPLEAASQAVRVNVSNGVRCWHLTDNLSAAETAIERPYEHQCARQYLQEAPSVSIWGKANGNIFKFRVWTSLTMYSCYRVSHYQPPFVTWYTKRSILTDFFPLKPNLPHCDRFTV